MRQLVRSIQSVTTLALLFAIVASLGCSPKAQYRLNSVRIRKLEKQYLYKREKNADGEVEVEEVHLTQAQLDNLGEILEGLFGTPDKPSFPAVLGDDGKPISLVKMDRLEFAAGPVRRDKNQKRTGLYREHCAHCHGVTGDGAGPTAAFLNPYPRDYRPGWFKFKSTLGKNIPPTNDDLLHILKEGIPDTAMPSFRLLPESELLALVDYVKYLSIRGEVERLLIDEITQLEPGELLVDFSAAGDADGSLDSQKIVLDEYVYEIASKWQRSSSRVLVNSAPPAQWETDADAHLAAIENGRKLFHTSLGNCFSCHGDTAIGDGQRTDYDDWTKDVFKPDPKTGRPDPQEVREYVALGAMKPRNIIPRNLRKGVFRGGRRSIDIFARVRNGIAGTPMPGNTALTDEQIWEIVEYVKSLQYEPLSRPPERKPVNERQRSS